MGKHNSRRKVGVRKVEVSDRHHIRFHYDPNLYLNACCRGGIWNFGDGEIAIAYRARPMDYSASASPIQPRHIPFTSRHRFFRPV